MILRRMVQPHSPPVAIVHTQHMRVVTGRASGGVPVLVALVTNTLETLAAAAAEANPNPNIYVQRRQPVPNDCTGLVNGPVVVGNTNKRVILYPCHTKKEKKRFMSNINPLPNNTTTPTSFLPLRKTKKTKTNKYYRKMQ